MGLYDTIIVKYPIRGFPDIKPFDGQTYDLGGGMEEYTITKAGTLYRTRTSMVGRWESKTCKSKMSSFCGQINVVWDAGDKDKDLNEVVFWLVGGKVRDVVLICYDGRALR